MKPNPISKWIRVTAFILVVSVPSSVIAASCDHQAASYSNCKQACINCSTGGWREGDCTCSQADQPVYCDCQDSRNCSDTGVQVTTNTASASGTCTNTGCSVTFGEKKPASPNPKQKQTSTC
jgi:hypothetical protein